MTQPYDHHSAAYARTWRQLHDEIRASSCPVHHSDAHGGFFVLTRYEDVAAAMKDDDTFSSRHDLDPDSPFGGITIPPAVSVNTPIETDPPAYWAFRKILAKPFSPASSRAWEPWLRDVATALLDQVIETGEIDLIHDFASPLPALLTAELLGLPLDEWRLYSDAAHDIVRLPHDTPEFEEAGRKWVEIAHRALAVAQQRRTEPAEDLLSDWVQADIDGEPLSDETLLQMCTLVIAGGNDTTTGLFGNAFVWLAGHPAERAWLAENPDRIDHACEEFLRYFTPTQSLARTVTRDTELGGQRFRRGDRILLSLAAANFDPDAFDAPHELRIDRFPNRHQSFGLGIHRCLGSNFTRVEFRVGLEEVLRRLPDLAIDTARSDRYANIGNVNGWNSIPATFTPGTREGSSFTL